MLNGKLNWNEKVMDGMKKLERRKKIF